MKKTMLTYKVLDKFEERVNIENLTSEDIAEIEHLAYCACMASPSREYAWSRFAYLVHKFVGIALYKMPSKEAQ